MRRTHAPAGAAIADGVIGSRARTGKCAKSLGRLRALLENCDVTAFSLNNDEEFVIDQ
jgi:hypothetical protein